ncbi:UNVERIFIED_CONTAM: putative polyol transporter 1 [Sesamum indicum]
MSGATIYIKRDLKISDVQIEILVGTINIYSLLGSAVAGRTSDWIGRRYTIVFASAIFFAGAILMGFAANYAFLMVGRFVAGIGVGYALMIAPVYAAEVAPASCRGFLTSFPEVFINFDQVQDEFRTKPVPRPEPDWVPIKPPRTRLGLTKFYPKPALN